MENSEKANVAKDEYQIQPDYVLDLDNRPKIDKHNWVERGLVVTCDGCGTHPPHRHAIKRNRVGQV